MVIQTFPAPRVCDGPFEMDEREEDHYRVELCALVMECSEDIPSLKMRPRYMTDIQGWVNHLAYNDSKDLLFVRIQITVT
jgi:hypothetical protein